MIKRVNFIGGPGAGKSTMAAYVFAMLKMQNEHVELVQEYVKLWAYEKTVVKPGDQIAIFAEQHRRELIPLRNGVKVIITDCPLFLSAFYGQDTMKADWELLWLLSKAHDRDYESLNIFLDRPKNKVYQTCGRYQTEEQARDVDKQLENFLHTFRVPFVRKNQEDLDGLVAFVGNKIRGF